MSTSVQNFYLGLLADPHANADLQEKIFAYASRRKHLRLLATLASHPNLTDKVDALLGEFPDAAVKAAWARRPGRSKDILEELARRDTRGSVLEGVAMVHGLSLDAYKKIATRKHRKALWALVLNLTVPHDIKETAAAALGRLGGEAIGHRESEQFKSTFAEMPELLPALISESTSVDLLVLGAASEDLSAGKLDEILVILLDRLTTLRSSVQKSNGRYYYGDSNTTSRLATALVNNAAVSLEQLREVIKLAELVTAEVAPRSYDPLSDFHNNLAARKSNGVASLTKGPSRTMLARSTTDREELVELAQNAATNKNTVLAGAVSSNPLTDGDIMDVVASSLGYYNIERALHTRLRDEDVVVAIFAAHPRYLSDSWLLKMPEPERVLTKVTVKVASKGAQLPLNIIHSRFMTPATALHLPLSSLGSEELPTSTRKATAAALQGALASSPERWEIFESVGEHFEGSLAELLSACGMLDTTEVDSEGFLQEIPEDAVSPSVESDVPQEVVVPTPRKARASRTAEIDPDQFTLL